VVGDAELCHSGPAKPDLGRQTRAAGRSYTIVTS
jgi:hypothetical protein